MQVGRWSDGSIESERLGFVGHFKEAIKYIDVIQLVENESVEKYWRANTDTADSTDAEQNCTARGLIVSS